MRIAPSIEGRLNTLYEAATRYQASNRDFRSAVSQRLAKEASTRKDILIDQYGNDAGGISPSEMAQSLARQFLRNEKDHLVNRVSDYLQDEPAGRIFVDDLLAHPKCRETRDAAATLRILCGKLIVLVEQQISSILKRYEKRNEKV